MTEEIFDVVDTEDRVVGQAPRSVVHAQHLLHRAVHVFCFNGRGELYVQLRSRHKDEYPLCYTSSASGHLAAGESYAEAAPRELFEEIGLRGPLEWLGKLPASPETAYEHTVLLRLVCDDPPVVNAAEIAALEQHTLPALFTLLDREPAKFSPPFATLLRWYMERGTRS